MFETLLVLAQQAQSPYNAKFAVAFAGAAAAIGVAMVGAKACEAVGRNPESFGKVLVLAIIGMALAEAIAFYALFLG